jgi:hypothetical protein
VQAARGSNLLWPDRGRTGSELLAATCHPPSSVVRDHRRAIPGKSARIMFAITSGSTRGVQKRVLGPLATGVGPFWEMTSRPSDLKGWPLLDG